MNIGDVSKASGLPAKTIRYYESIGLIGAPSRGDCGYRSYTDADVNTLRFLRRARDLGFSTAHMRELLSLWQDRSRDSSAVKKIALAHVAKLEKTIAGLTRVVGVLNGLADACDGNERPLCPIIDGLAETDL